MMNNTSNNTRIQSDLTDVMQKFSQLMPGGAFCYDADDNQEFLFISSSMPGMFGYTMGEFRARFKNRFPEMVYIEDRERILQEIKDQTKNGTNDYCMYRVEMADGTLKWIFDRGRLITDKNGKRWFYVVIVDADEIKVAEHKRIEYEKQLLNELRGQAEYDIMTGLLNRYTAVTRIEKAIQKCLGGTLILLNIDNLRAISDAKGERYGNQLLKDIAFSIRQLVHPEEILAYFGENKFIIFLPGSCNTKNAERRAADIVEAVHDVIGFENEHGKCSIGFTISDNGETSFDEMLFQADIALNRKKKKSL